MTGDNLRILTTLPTAPASRLLVGVTVNDALTALIRKGLLNDDLKLTDAGIAALGRN